jgi:hypothetical protein
MLHTIQKFLGLIICYDMPSVRFPPVTILPSILQTRSFICLCIHPSITDTTQSLPLVTPANDTKMFVVRMYLNYIVRPSVVLSPGDFRNHQVHTTYCVMQAALVQNTVLLTFSALRDMQVYACA